MQKAWTEKHTQHSPEKHFPHKHFPLHGKERNYQAKEQTDHNKVKTNETQIVQNWVIFTYDSPLEGKIAKLFKNTDINVPFKAGNTICQQLAQIADNSNPSGIYAIECSTCNKNYVGQTGWYVTTRLTEHIRHIKTNKPVSGYATHILNNRHEYGTANYNLKLVQPCGKSKKMNHWENMYIQVYRQQNLIITEQQINEPNPLYKLAQLPYAITNSSRPDSTQTGKPDTHANR
jgi:hypothetical protein